MIKSSLLASAICLTFVVPVYAQQAVQCDDATLTKMRADIDMMTDADKKAQAMENWTAADTAFKANKTDECVALLGRSDNSAVDKNNNNTTTTN